MGANDKVLLKIFKLFKIIQKKKKYSLIFFKNWGGKAPFSPCDGPPLPISAEHFLSCHALHIVNFYSCERYTI